jgi:hypothetical protein
MHQFGAAAAAWAAGATRGWFGSYTFAFVSAGATCLLASLLVTQIKLPGRAQQAPAEPVAVPI